MTSVNSNSMYSENKVNVFIQELDQLELCAKGESINAAELEGLLERVGAIGQKILADSTRHQQSNAISSHLSEIKERIQKLRAFLGEKDVAKRILFPQEETNPFSRQKQFIDSLNSSLISLEERFDDFEKFGHLIEKFESISTFPESLASYKEAFFNGLFGSIISKITHQVFGGHKSQVNLAKGRKEIAALDEVINKNRTQLEQLIEKFCSLDSLPSTPKIEKEKLAIKEKNADLLEKHREILQRREDLVKKYSENEKRADQAKATRQNLCSIGGSNVKIKVEGNTLDGMYLSADSFREALKEAGAKTFDLKYVSKFPQTDDITLRGLCFPPNTDDHIVNKALVSLGAFTSPDREGAGWQKVFLSDGSVAVVTDEEAENLKHYNLIDGVGNLVLTQDWEVHTTLEEWDVDQSKAGGTVILTSGNYGVYEMHKREILSFLMRGMNVMVFNFRGYGESTGSPTQRTVSRDLEAVYQYVKESHNTPDDRILFKALCMSGGAAAKVASNHPEVNLFIDQSYANFSDVITQEAADYIQQFAKKNEIGRGRFLALQALVSLKP